MRINVQPVLPDEIFSLVFSFLEDDGFIDRRTLLAFSLVSRRFRQWCQGLAIRHLELTTEHGEKRVCSLERATAMNASIGPSVQSLRLDFHTQFHTPRTRRAMAKFLSRLSNIKAFELSIDFCDARFLQSWSSISEPIRIILARILTSPKLSTLTLTYMTFPLTQLFNPGSAFTNLRELTIFVVDDDHRHDAENDFTERTVASSKDAVAPISLRRLSISPGDAKPLLESSRFDWESVRTLEIMPREPLFPQSGSELKGCRDMLARTKNLSRLQNAEFGSIAGQLDTLFSSVDPEFYISLTHIDLYLDWSRPRWRVSTTGVGGMETAPGPWGFDHKEEPYMGLFDALSTFPSGNVLETVCVSMCLKFRNDEAAAFAFNSRHWTRISSILTPERFPSLTLVYVGVRMPPRDYRPSVDAVRDELGGMPWGHLQASGKLKLDVFSGW